MYFFFAAIAISLASSHGARADLETVTKLEPRQNVAGVGQQFSVNVTVSDVQNLFALEVNLYWNQSVLQLLSTQTMLGVEANPDGVLYGYGNLTSIETVDVGHYQLHGTPRYSDISSFNGSGTIVEMTFNVTDIGSCPLTLQTKLYEKGSFGTKPISHSTQDGQYSPIYMATSSTEVVLGLNVTISGYVVAENTVDITIQYLPENESSWLVAGTTTTDSNGNYSLSWKPLKDGNYQLTAITTIQNIKAKSATMSILVTPRNESWISLYVLIAAVAIAVSVIAGLAIYTRKAKRRRSK